jgi:hypothetical protein
VPPGVADDAEAPEEGLPLITTNTILISDLTEILPVFTRFMSWLVVLIPVLLMLAAVGLERLEKHLHQQAGSAGGDEDSPTPVSPGELGAPAHTTAPRTPGASLRHHGDPTGTTAGRTGSVGPGHLAEPVLPTRRYTSSPGERQFHTTKSVNYPQVRHPR